MNNWYDLTSEPSLQKFPWTSTIVGLANAHKTVTTFYGDIHSTGYADSIDEFPDRNTWRWYNALRFGVPVEGFNVNLNSYIGQYWWARIDEAEIWKPVPNQKFFPELMRWITESEIFKSTGRIVFFIQLQGQNSPDHTDFDPQKVPPHLREPSQFLWLTPQQNPKSFRVGGEKMPWACWFNHFIPHGTEAADRPQWSLRIDGKFTDSFRQRHSLP